MVRLCLCYDCLHLVMLVFNYMIRLYNQDVSVGAAPAIAESTTDWRGSAAESAIEWRGSAIEWRGSTAVGSAHSWRERTSWNIVRNYLSSTIAKVADDVADKRNECWWGQWWSRTLGYPTRRVRVHGRFFTRGWHPYPTRIETGIFSHPWVTRRVPDSLLPL
jgi:hypothetical protein